MSVSKKSLLKKRLTTKTAMRKGKLAEPVKRTTGINMPRLAVNHNQSLMRLAR